MNAVDLIIRWSTVLAVLGVVAIAQVSTTFTSEHEHDAPGPWVAQINDMAEGYAARDGLACLYGLFQACQRRCWINGPSDSSRTLAKSAT